MNIKIKRLNTLAKIPTQADIGSAGYDLYAATDCDIQIPPHSNVLIGTGIAMAIPLGYFGGIYARSFFALYFIWITPLPLLWLIHLQSQGFQFLDFYPLLHFLYILLNV